MNKKLFLEKLDMYARSFAELNSCESYRRADFEDDSRQTQMLERLNLEVENLQKELLEIAESSTAVPRMEDGQETPRDQMLITLSAMEGWIPALRNGNQDPVRIAMGLEDLIRRGKGLMKRFPSMKWSSK